MKTGVLKLNKNKQKPNRIAELRHKYGISQEKLAEELNVTQASISLYENRNNIPTDILIKIARYFEVTVDYLLMASETERDISVSNLSIEENGVVRFYRSLPTKYRKLVDKFICMSTFKSVD